MRGALLLVMLFGSTPLCAQEQKNPTDLTQLSLEDLMQLEVTSVSKKEEPLFDAPAAIYVLTQEDIHRSGATSIPEALRMVPGLEVAQIDANKWAISARGFNDQFANKLLVLIDGRSVYSPSFSGVHWDVQDMMLEDIDRIEVIRGPGATLWGANAVNGVINIISKSAKKTQGMLATTGFGSHEQGFGSVRYGGKVGESLSYRLYLKYFNRDNFKDRQGHDAADAWDMLRGGFRLDWGLAERDMLTLQGDLYDGDVGETFTGVSLLPPYSRRVRRADEVLGGNVLGRWNHSFSEWSSTSLQLYYDRSDREVFYARNTLDTFDLNFQHDLVIDPRQAVVWGLGYRVTVDKLRTLPGLSDVGRFDPVLRQPQLFSAFVQDKLILIPERLAFTVGSKFEHNDYSGFEVQPSARLLWTPSARHTVWGAVSRAVHTPSRAENDIILNLAAFPTPSGVLNTVTLFGDRTVKAEELMAYELGYRLQPLTPLSLDLATFYNVYDDLTNTEPDSPFFAATAVPPRVVLPQRIANKRHGETYGVEVAGTFVATAWWRLQAGYTWLERQQHKSPGNKEVLSTVSQGQDPHNQFQFRSYIDLPWHLQFDTMLYYVDNLAGLGIPSYVRLDLRLGWQLGNNLELSVVGQNLTEKKHREFRSSFFGPSAEIERSMYGKMTWKW